MWPIAFAHRGAKAHAPENTVEAFSLALRLGANGLETDVWITADGHVVLDHDGVARVRGRKRPIKELKRDQLASHVPTIDDFFEACGVRFHLSVDIKDDDATDGLVRGAMEHGFPLDRLWICHHHHGGVLDIRSRFENVKVVDSTRLGRLKTGLEPRAAADAQAGIDVINMHSTDWSGGSVTLVHRFGLLAFGWDMQHPRQLETGLLMGLDGVYSDHVDRMVETYSALLAADPPLDQVD